MVGPEKGIARWCSEMPQNEEVVEVMSHEVEAQINVLYSNIFITVTTINLIFLACTVFVWNGTTCCGWEERLFCCCGAAPARAELIVGPCLESTGLPLPVDLLLSWLTRQRTSPLKGN